MKPDKDDNYDWSNFARDLFQAENPDVIKAWEEVVTAEVADAPPALPSGRG